MDLSAGAHHRMLELARTFALRPQRDIADLAGEENIQAHHPMGVWPHRLSVLS